MRFSDYLFFTQQLTCQDYADLVVSQNREADHGFVVGRDPKDFCPYHINSVKNLEAIRRVPFGEILREHPRILQRLKTEGDPDENSVVDRLIKEWEDWHVKRLEPICTYSLNTKIGRELYKRQEEKQLVARYVANNLIHDADCVAIAEGSSAAYVGMAISLLRQRCSIITSNDPLLREYRDNRQLASRLKEMKTIGGIVDEFIVHGGVAGMGCEEQFESAIKHNPGATVVIMAVTALLPEQGPFGMDAATCALKRKMIKATIDANVRSLVFITDYSKHLPSRIRFQDSPVFENQEWQAMLREKRGKIWIVTTPPPRLRARIAAHGLGQTAVRRYVQPDYTLDSEADEADGAKCDADEYDEIAMQFATAMANLSHQPPNECRFIEAVSEEQILPEDLAPFHKIAGHKKPSKPGDGGPNKNINETQ